MTATHEIALSKNQLAHRGNELDVEGEARLDRAFRHFWHPVMYACDLGDAPRRAVLCGEQLVIVRLAGEVCAFNDLCAHRGTALSLGAVVNDGAELRCPYHGWQYDRSGVCTLAPQRPDLAGHLRARVRKYHAEERYGLIWVCLEPEPHLPLPEFPWFEDDSHTVVYLPSEDWACSAPRRMENYCDLSHLAFVHDGYLGDVNRPEMPPHEVWRDGACLHMRWERDAPNDVGKYSSLAPPETDTVNVVSHWRLYMPLTVCLDSVVEQRGRYVLFFHATPIAPKVTRNFTVASRNYGEPEEIRREITEFQKIVYDQDKPVVESQRPEELSEDLSFEMHLKGVDTFSIAYRSELIKIAKSLIPSQ